ncbi:MAG: hypothetical protein Q7S55_03780 [Nanoarchaeota archaeon]|nr:hypothetical protein [Nanoarchaeota archaeon]
MAQDRRDLLESEIVSLKELTAVRIQELEKLQSVIDKNMKKETAPYLFTQNLERKITDLDLKQAEFIHEVELAQKVKTTDATALLSEEWNDLHQQVIDTETAFLLHNQKENEEARQLVEIIKNNSLENMYFTLVVGLLLLLLLLLLLNQNNGQK